MSLAYTLGRCIGAAAGAVAALAWVYTMWMPGAGLELTGVSFAVGFLMTVFALIAVISSWHGHATILFAMFLASFLPVGAVLLRADHWLRFIGVLDLCLLAAAVLIWRGAPAAAPADGSD